MPVGDKLTIVADEETCPIEHLRITPCLLLIAGKSLEVAVAVDTCEEQAFSTRHDHLIIETIEHKHHTTLLFLKNLLSRPFPT